MNYKIYVEYISRRHGGEPLSDEPYSDREPEYIDFYITKCSADKSLVGISREEHEVNFEPKSGNTVYVVYVRYSTGDSFGHTNGEWSIIDILDSMEHANKLKESIDSGEYERNNGHAPWTGYFESLESSNIEKFILG